jgi:hypothetical protein
MLQVNKQVNLINFFTGAGRILACVVLLLATSNGYAQTITKTASPTVQVPSTVGRITKWAGEKNGAGILGDSVITESAGNIVVGGNATANTISATTLNVSGNATVGGTLSANLSGTTVNATTLNVSGNATVGGTLSGNAVNATTLNVSGDASTGGTVSGNIVNATTQYNIGGFHVLSGNGSNVSAGRGAGGNLTTGQENSFFGTFAGANTDSGRGNSFFGREAGERNTTGNSNALFGVETGENNTTGINNSFFGAGAGGGNTTGSNNTLIGTDANVLSGNLDHATAIGADATVLFSNQIVLGRSGGSDSVFVPGNLTVGGTLFKSGGSFTIDYPLDPANKTLSHSFVESPDMMNIYNGNVTTDAKGEAQVTLPIYFPALNRDFRYQLTVIGQFAQAIVANEIKDNSFTVKTDKPNVKVSWQVTGIRQDAFANANRIQVVEDKGKQRGTYLHPELFNSASARAPGTDPR